MKVLRSGMIAFGILISVVHQSAAQFEALSDLAKNFSDLAIQWGALSPRNGGIHPESDPNAKWIASYGTEFIFDISPKKTESKCDSVGRGAPKERQIRNASAYHDSIDVYVLKTTCSDDKPNPEMEIGVGFFQSARFTNQGATGEVTGVLRETPTISLYATWVTKILGGIQPYGALRVGVTQLAALSLEDTSGRFFSASGPSSVEIGSVGGLVYRIPKTPLNIFVEASPVMYRPFSGIRWESNKDIPTQPVAPPAAAIKRLDFTGRSLMIGFQVTVKPQDKK